MTGAKTLTPTSIALRAEIKRLREHIDAEGYRLTLAEIGTRVGLTRSAVAGHVGRMGLPCLNGAYRKPYKSTDHGRKPKPPKPVPEPAVAPDEPIPLHLDMLDIRSGQCQWPYSDGPFTLCGHATKGHGPYCSFHNTKAYATKSPSLQRMEAGGTYPTHRQFGR